MTERFPERYVNRAYARQRWGRLADFYAGFYTVGDPLADAAVAAFAQMQPGQGHRLLTRALDEGAGAVPDMPAELLALLEAVERVPDWVDFQRINLGARAYQRTGAAAPLVLSAWSLMNGYHSAPAVKPLAFTKALDAMAPRRLAETGRFVTETVQVDGLRRFAPGFKTAVKVRVMHALVRQMLQRSGEWNDDWGYPINQCDMVGTVVEFSWLMLEGTRKMGYRFTHDESEAIVHLWRYAGYLSGVDERLLRHFDTEAHMRHLAEMIYEIQPGPDESSLALAAALRKVPLQAAGSAFERAIARWTVKYHDGMTWALNGDEIARDLEIPNRSWRWALWPTRLAVGAFETWRALTPGGDRVASWLGNRLVRYQVDRMLERKEPSYQPKRVAIDAADIPVRGRERRAA